jgi:hypothetical protein
MMATIPQLESETLFLGHIFPLGKDGVPIKRGQFTKIIDSAVSLEFRFARNSTL